MPLFVFFSPENGFIIPSVVIPPCIIFFSSFFFLSCHNGLLHNAARHFFCGVDLSQAYHYPILFSLGFIRTHQGTCCNLSAVFQAQTH